MNSICITFAIFAPLRLCALCSLLLFGVLVGISRAEDNALSADEQAGGWVLLFNGRDLGGWKNNDGKPVAAKIEDGAINVRNTGGYLLVYDQEFGDFVFKCDVKLGPAECNSGVFLRIGDLADPVNTGLEVQVYDGPLTGRQDFGAIYDLVEPTKEVATPTGEWIPLEIRCEGPNVSVKVNGEEIATMNCDDYDKPGLRTDGTAHKFTGKAIKDFPRTGYIGLQDHGNEVWFKNVKLKEL